MSKKHIIKANVYATDVTDKIKDVAEKVGIILPSSHTAIFRTVYAEIEKPNGNNIRLAKEAVDSALPGLIGSQVNIGHRGYGFLVGIILDAFLNENDEIETVFTFAKNIYSEEYVQALEKMQAGELSVSFELLASVEGQEVLPDGTIRLHDIDFQGQGFLIDENPACDKAVVFEVAKKYKDRALHSQENDKLEEKELMFATRIVKTCDKVLAEETQTEDEVMWATITTRTDQHIHVTKIDSCGDGQTEGTFGDNEDPHVHEIVNYQIQAKKGHAHRLIEELLAKRKNDLLNKEPKKAKDTPTTQGGNTTMTEEQKKLIADLRSELGVFAKDVSDEELLDEAKVTELKNAKKEADSEEEEKTNLEQAQEKIAELEAANAELKATIEAKDSETESVRKNAEKIGKLKVELKDNTYVVDFSDEDYLDEAKVASANLQKERDDLKAENEELSKKAKETKEKLRASTADNSEKDLETGDADKDEPNVHDILNKHYAK